MLTTNKIIFLLLICFLLAISCQSETKQIIANQVVRGRIYEVSLVNYDSLAPNLCPPPTYLILETQNTSNQTITLCSPELTNKRDCGNGLDISFYTRRYKENSQTYAYVYECCTNPIIIPPNSNRTDTISIGVLPANNSSQQKNIEEYTNNKKTVLYIPHKNQNPYYQDTIFYLFDKNTKYIQRKNWSFPKGREDCL